MTYDVDLTGFPAERDMSMIEPVVKGSTTQDVYQAYLRTDVTYSGQDA